MAHVFQVLGAAVSLRDSPVHGRGAFATRPARAGEVLLVEYGLLFARCPTDMPRGEAAANELAERNALLCCPALMAELWPRCATLEALVADFRVHAPPVAMRQPALQVAVAAMSHAAQKKINENAFRLGALQVERPAFWRALCGRVATGAETEADAAAMVEEGGREYSYLSFKTCAFNHSDAPNAVVAFDVRPEGARAVVCALTDVETGQELFLDYGSERVGRLAGEVQDSCLALGRLRASLLHQERALRRLDGLALGPCRVAVREIADTCARRARGEKAENDCEAAARAVHLPIALTGLMQLYGPAATDLLARLD